MLYLSDILDAFIRDQTDVKVGRLVDIVIKDDVQDYPPVYGIIVDGDKHGDQQKFIRIGNIESFTRKNIIIKKQLNEAIEQKPHDINLICLRATILDKQIVDLGGIRVVRVNDLQLGYIKDRLCLMAIDIGRTGLLRRLGLRHFALAKSELVDWKDVSLVGDKIQLTTTVKDLVKLHPADIANIIEKLNLNQSSQLLAYMDECTAARVLEEVRPEMQKILVEKLGPERASNVMQKMSVDELVDLIQLLPTRESRQIMNILPTDMKKQHVKKILEYDEDQAGGLMSTEYITARQEQIAEEVVAEIRKRSHEHSSIYFIYIVDEAGKFLGVVSLRRLIMANKDEIMKSIMKKGKKIPTAKVEDDLLEVAVLMTKYNLYSTAVLDDKGKLLGVVTIDDIMRHFVPHA